MGDLPFAVRWSLLEHRLQYFRGGLRPRWWGSPVRWLGRSLYWVRRYFQGARSIKCAAFEDTFGCYSDDDADVPFSGACPVQGDGFVDGHPCYYRSRGEGWEFEVYARGADLSCELPNPIWSYGERLYFWPDGGWVAASVSEACIARAVAKFRCRERSRTELHRSWWRPA